MKRRLELSLDEEAPGAEHPANRIFETPARRAAKGRAAKKSATVVKKGGRAVKSNGATDGLKKTDRRVLEHLQELKRQSRKKKPEGGDCVASIPELAEACFISPRQVQISTGRLIEAKMLERVGYDFANADRKSRGTIYKVLA